MCSRSTCTSEYYVRVHLYNVKLRVYLYTTRNATPGTLCEQVCSCTQSFSAATAGPLLLALLLLFLLPRAHVHVHLARRDDCINHVLFFQAPHH